MAFFDTEKSKLYIAQFDLSSVCVDMGVQSQEGLYDVTTFGDGGRKWSRGLADDKLTIETIYTDAAGGSDDILNVILRARTKVTGPDVITALPGGDALSAQGYSTNHGWIKNPVINSRVGNRVDLSAGELEMSEMDAVKSLQARHTSNITADENGTAIDDGAATSAGGVFVVHAFVLTASGGNTQWVMRLQMDTTGGFSSPTDAATLTFTNATGPQALRTSFTGSFERHVRIQFDLDATSGTLQAWAGYERL